MVYKLAVGVNYNSLILSRQEDEAVTARRAHNPKVAGSAPNNAIFLWQIAKRGFLYRNHH